MTVRACFHEEAPRAASDGVISFFLAVALGLFVASPAPPAELRSPGVAFLRLLLFDTLCNRFLERAMGIEPTSEAWEASILPLNYARSRPCETKNIIAIFEAQQRLASS